MPITLQGKVDDENNKLLAQGHIEKLEECSDKYFVSPIVITVKKRRLGEIGIRIKGVELANT